VDADRGAFRTLVPLITKSEKQKIKKYKLKKRKVTKLKILAKISIIVVAIAAIFSTQSFSQPKLGIEAGLNLSNSSFSPDLRSGSRTGIMIGGFAEFKVSPLFSIKPGLRYIMKGFSVGDGWGNQNTFKLNYIEAPVLLKVNFPVQQVKPYVEAGPTVALRISSTVESIDGDVDASEAFETIDFGLYFGSGLDFRVANNIEMFTGIGYSLGLSNTLSAINGNITGKNNGFKIISGVKFDL